MGFRVIQVDTTAGTAVTPAAGASPQVIKSYQLSASDDEWISVYALFTITSSATPAAQSIPLQIVVGSNTFSLPFAQIAAVSPTEIAPVLFKCVSRAGDTVSVQIPGSLTADTHTSINVVAFYINAESGYPGGT